MTSMHGFIDEVRVIQEESHAFGPCGDIRPSISCQARNIIINNISS